jgi:penicillin-binding protein A
MNRPIRGVALFSLLMVMALMVNTSIAYLAESDFLNNNALNRRVTDARFGQDRGPIMVGNSPIADSVVVTDQFGYQRTYPVGELYAPITGYYTYQYGASALESSFSSELSGEDNSQFLSRLIGLASGAGVKGGTVETTINAKAQKAAWKALAGRKGAVVAINYKTGAVLAMVTSPSYDPSELATHNLTKASQAWNRLNADASKPMANRATKEIYSPGSTFKLVTAAAALESGLSADSKIDAKTFKVGSWSTSENCGGSTITLTKALETSCNPAFARLGAGLGADALRTQSEKFGFGSKFVTDVGSVASVFPSDLDPTYTAMSAIGLYEVAATPLQMAMVSAAIANDGVLMQPYIVQKVLDSDLRVTSQTTATKYGQAMSSSSAAQLKKMMVGVVQSGTGTRAQIKGVTVGGKTGTAAVDKNRTPYAWFTSWADDPSVAVCVLVEDSDLTANDTTGGRVAAPVAKAVIESLR